MFILPTFTLPAYLVASSSTAGAIIRHGAHQGAQKSTKTGTFELRTSLSKLSSPKVMTFAFAIEPMYSRPRGGLAQSIEVLLFGREQANPIVRVRPRSFMPSLHNRMFIAQPTL